jgi:hypothetical protein
VVVVAVAVVEAVAGVVGVFDELHPAQVRLAAATAANVRLFRFFI